MNAVFIHINQMAVEILNLGCKILFPLLFSITQIETYEIVSVACKCCQIGMRQGFVDSDDNIIKLDLATATSKFTMPRSFE